MAGTVEFTIEFVYDPDDPNWIGWYLPESGSSGNDPLTKDAIFELIENHIMRR